MTTFAGGMTPSEYYSSLNSLGSIMVFNVKSYGAKGDNSTDDTTFIQDAINAAFTAGGGVVYFPVGIYIIGGALQTNVGGINYKSQLYIPATTYTNKARARVLLKGETAPNYHQNYSIGASVGSTATTSGVILKSTLISSTALSYIIASIGPATNYNSFNPNQCDIEDIQLQTTPSVSNEITLGGIGFHDAICAVIKRVSVFPYNLALVDSALPINNCVGIAMPKINCEHISIVDTCNVGGFETGFLCGEHTNLKNTVAMSCLYGYNFTANFHHVLGDRISAFWCVNPIYFSGVAYVKINGLQTEWDDLGKWYDAAFTVLDASNQGHGEIHYSIVEAEIGFNNAKFNKSGGANLQCYPIAFAAASSFTVTGKRNDATALTDLLAKLAAKGIIIDGTTAS